MRIGVSSWALPWALGVRGYPRPEKPPGALELLERAVKAGAEALQIADNLPLHALSRPELGELAAEAKNAGISLEAGTRGLKPENLLRYLDIAGLLGARLVRTLPHDGADRPDFAEALRGLGAVKGAFGKAGVTLAVENHDFYPSLWLKRLAEEAGSPCVGVCLDAANNLGLGESFHEVVANLGGLTVNFHCKDYRIARKPTMLGFDVTGCPAGSGMLNLKLARNALRGDISWIIESWTPWQGDIETTVAMESRWLDEGVANLRRFRESGSAAECGGKEARR